MRLCFRKQNKIKTKAAAGRKAVEYMKQTEKRLPERGEGLGRAASRDGRDVRPSRRGAGPTGSNVGLLTAHLMSRTEVLGNRLALRVRDFNKHTSGDPVAHGFSGTLACRGRGGWGLGAGSLGMPPWRWLGTV